jgi:tRNA dimethylallyltransferase
MSAPSRLVVILGPTASGKSALGIWLAERLGGEILVCDSTQVYRRFNIGTAKLPLSEQRGIPHHLIDLVEPEEVFTAGDYRRRALEALRTVGEQGKLPIVTAGTGLYLRALLEGLADAPARSEELRSRLRRRAERFGAGYLHRLLERLDPGSAERIAPRDTQKVIRALEIRALAGKPRDEVFRVGKTPLEGFQVHKIGLMPARKDLYGRIESRVRGMLAAGWVEEVRQLAREGIPAAAKPFQFIGYSDIRSHLEGHIELDEVTLRIQKATRRYAKRQLTWFRRESGVRWLFGFGDSEGIQCAAMEGLEAAGVGKRSTVSYGKD